MNPSAMKVLHIGKYYYPQKGGIETQLSLLCQGMRERVDLEVVVCGKSLRRSRELIGGVDVTRCPEIFNMSSTSLCPTMAFELSRREYDVLHIHFPHPMGVLAYLASKRPRRHSVVVTYHSDIIRQERLLRLYRPFMNRVLDQADAILCGTQAYIDSSQQLRPYRNKCQVVPFGIDVARFETPQSKSAVAAIRARYPGPIVLTVGRLIYYKGFEYAIRALANVDATLLLVGTGPLRPQLERLALDIGVGERVQFLGELQDEELVSYYRAADVFVLPSVARSEAFGVVQLEAMASGVPVINTALDSGVAVVSRHGETGLTIPPADPRALAEALSQLLRDPEVRKRMGEAGRRRVRAEYTRDSMVSRTLEVYSQVAPWAALRDARDYSRAISA